MTLKAFLILAIICGIGLGLVLPGKVAKVRDRQHSQFETLALQ